ncbi:tryparedoxin-like protein [Leptomonas seymouri]|uniref:Tryparedoxin-like protein n=1 Tax=Leptomonas seymouri TaxID=5684 RepID=A0A0N0P317_LEPSE|nr:tryparedoxin-like protein [Leptomonas seymouri]|eukprot:KPI83137.1 tryparedoxin-like protein [Leptomonas seymouri]
MPFDLFHRSSSYTLIRQDGLTVNLPQALRAKRYVILFLAGQWWAPCRGVTSQLKAFYRRFHETHSFEVIFLSADKSEGSMLDFFHDAHGDWLCLNYADARTLESELAGEGDLHPKQIPACLVFELGEAAFKGSSRREAGKQDVASELHGTSVYTSLFSSSTPQSFARLITRQGREMLSRDRDGALFPWYDDGWNDAAAHQRSAALRNSSSAHAPTTPPHAEDIPTVASNSVAKTKHENAVLHTDPCLRLRPPSSSSVATPSSQPVTTHQYITASGREGNENAWVQENSEAVVNDVEKDGTTAALAADALPTVAHKSDVPLDARCEETTPSGPRKLTYSKSPVSHDKVKAAPSPPCAVTVGRELAATLQTANVDQEKGNTEDSEVNKQEDLGLQKVLEIHVSAMVEELLSNESSTESGDVKDADASTPSAAEHTKECSAAKEGVLLTSSPQKAAETGVGDDNVQDVKEAQPRSSTGWKALFGL